MSVAASVVVSVVECVAKNSVPSLFIDIISYEFVHYLFSRSIF